MYGLKFLPLINYLIMGVLAFLVRYGFGLSNLRTTHPCPMIKLDGSNWVYIKDIRTISYLCNAYTCF